MTEKYINEVNVKTGRAYHDTAANTVSMNGLGREHEELMSLEASVDIAASTVSKQIYKNYDANILVVTVARNNAGDDTLEQSHHLPRRGSSFSVPKKALLRHDRDSISSRTGDRRENVVPDVCLVLLL